jgi:hypothetical protein
MCEKWSKSEQSWKFILLSPRNNNCDGPFIGDYSCRLDAKERVILLRVQETDATGS